MKIARSLTALLLGLGFGLLLVASCGDDSGSNPKGESPRKTPQGLLDYYVECLEEQNLAGYEACLWESYLFGFSEPDWDSAGVTPDNPYWGLTEDVASTENMFASAQVLNINAALLNVSNFTGPDSLLTIRCKPMIDVTIEGPHGEEPVVKQVRNSYLDFVLRPDPHDEDLWVIREIQEELAWYESPRPVAVESSTFGEIKCIFK